MRSYEELEALWRDSPPSPRGRGVVRLICVRKAAGVHECPPAVRVSEEGGVDGDRWLDKPGRRLDSQVTLMRARVAELIAADHAPLDAAGDNFLVDLDIGEEVLPAGARLRLGGALLVVSEAPHTGCKKFRERFGLEALRWVNEPSQRALRLRGVNCSVLAGGTVAVGDAIELVDA